jgi:hypothetical protein
MNENLQSLVAVMNAALEHVPDQTKAILVANAQPALKGLEADLLPRPAPINPAQTSPCG